MRGSGEPGGRWPPIVVVRDRIGSTSRLQAVTDLDLSTAGRLPREVNAALEQMQCFPRSRCELDASAVFVDLTGLRALLVAADGAACRGVQLVVRPSPLLRSLLAVLGWRDRLMLTETSHAA